MDFDDLDAEIDARIADGDVEALGAIAATLGKKTLKTFVPTEGMKPIPRDHRLPCSQDYPAKILEAPKYLRMFMFLGMGASTLDYQFVETFPDFLEVALYEMPGHGKRVDEDVIDDIEALGDDAFAAVKPAMEQVCEGADMEGAPFVFLGQSLGAQVMTFVAKKILLHFGMVPSAVIIIDRAPLQYPLLSEEGKAALQSDPDDVLQSFDLSRFPLMNKKVWANDMMLAADERDPFFHKFECDVTVLTADKNMELEIAARKGASNYKMATLKIQETDESILLPMENGAKVKTLTTTLADIFAYRRDTAKVSVLNVDQTTLKDDDDVPATLVVVGLQDFKFPRYPWPHPVGIIGGGFQGIKTAMQYMVHRNENFVLFDRHYMAGGDAWHNAATKHSKIQTDFGAFNIWFGHEYNWTGNGGWGSVGTGPAEGRNVFAQPYNGTGAGSGVDYHPVRHQVLHAMQHACEEYGIDKYTLFETDVIEQQLVGKEDAHERYYKLTGKNIKEGAGGATKVYPVSLMYHYPGAYDVNRIIDYPGESSFGGQIGYGMGHDNQGGKFCWDDGKMKHARGAILGNGAFSIENVRSCAENGASKVYLITRRKSLACPRLPCWFCHQGAIPTPAGFLIQMFELMYAAGKFESPWDFYAVQKNADNTFISQSSRFGIGDVTFICHAYGILEYRTTVLERCSPKTLHLKSGEKLDNCTFLIKALGLLGDPRVDKLHRITHRIGNFVNGDYRICMSADATGMHAARFTTFSAGPGACSYVKQYYYIHQHPWEMEAAIAQGMLKIMPKHVLSNTQPDQTVYMTNVQYEMAAGGIMSGYFPNLPRVMGDEGTYKHCLLHNMHPTDKFLEYCQKDWDRYQKMFQENNGVTADWVPYPYTKEIIEGWFAEYNKMFPFFPTNYNGPDPGMQAWVIKQFKDDWERRQQEHIPLLIKESPLCSTAKADGSDPFMEAQVSSMVPKRRKYMGSSADCALDFNTAMFADWRGWMDSEYTYTQAGVQAKSADIMNSPETWGSVFRAIEGHNSAKNLPTA